jgi:hypothetical protein
MTWFDGPNGGITDAGGVPPSPQDLERARRVLEELARAGVSMECGEDGQLRIEPCEGMTPDEFASQQGELARVGEAIRQLLR